MRARGSDVRVVRVQFAFRRRSLAMKSATSWATVGVIEMRQSGSAAIFGPAQIVQIFFGVIGAWGR